MPDRMQPAHRFARAAALLLVALVLAAAACTSGGGNEPGPTGSTGTGGGNPTPVQTATGPPGTAVYRYANAGLVATMRLDGEAGTLEIENGTGRELPPPDFYILDARDGRRVKGGIAASTSIPDGQTMTFDVSFSGLGIDDIGLVILLMGRDNYGAFARQ